MGNFGIGAGEKERGNILTRGLASRRKTGEEGKADNGYDVQHYCLLVSGTTCA